MNKFIIIVWMCFITAANSQTFTNFTSAVGIEKTELKWSTGTPAVEVHVAVSAAAFLSSVGTVKSVYTSSGGVELVSCVIVISSSTCVIDAAQCNRQIGYDVECSGNTAAFTPILKIASLSETNDNNSVLNFPSSDVVGISSWNFSPLTMTVEDCDKDHFKPSATASRPDSSCGYNCVETLICDVCTGSNFTSQCQATVVWSPETDPCPAGCPVSDFLGRGTSENEALGEFHTCGTVPRFKCNSSLVCGDTYFTPTCGLDAHWSFTNTDDICFKLCGRLTDASISAICLGIIWVVLDLFLAFFACCTKSDEDVCSLDWLTEVIKKMMKNMPCCKYWTAYWILGSSTSVVIVVVGIIVIVTSTPGDCCGLDEQAIVGIVIAVLGILFIALFLSAVFRVKKKTAKISPRPANSNSEQPEETVELNATSGSKP